MKPVVLIEKDGKIQITKKEMEDLLNEAYWEGHWDATHKNYYTITTNSWPYSTYQPYTLNSTGTTVSGTATSSGVTIGPTTTTYTVDCNKDESQ